MVGRKADSEVRQRLMMIDDASLFEAQFIASESAELFVYETGLTIPFEVRRVFTVHAQQPTERGRHAHRECGQVMVCVAGRCEVDIDDGDARRVVALTQPRDALYVPPSIWAEQRYLEEGTTMMVLCDHSYDEGDYIRDYQDFIAYRQGRG